MKFIADIHVHSKFSRATAKNLDLERLYIAARQKGVSLVGTGDVTHPVWVEELAEKLVPAEPGLFRLKSDIEKALASEIPSACSGEVRFILQGEISNIYKKADRTRKNHQVVLLPDLDAARRFNRKLDAIGNISSDGRPILGLDARDLLEILMDAAPEATLVPAHIWTPWFSVLGSKSGFDSIEECFEDLTLEIFAVETGLSSDPPMNWRVSSLDKFVLLSNSDAHSPFTLGRNANCFDTELSYSAFRSALKTGNPAQCLGTLDLYPEEGKYHYDGHRKCNICLHPAEAMKFNDICPECGKPLTLGVLRRAVELADHPQGRKPASALPCRHIIPLPEIISEIFGKGPKTKTVDAGCQTALNALGPELDILLDAPIDAIDAVGIPLLGEAIRRMRAETVHISPGYDGEYGRITLFTDEEREEINGQKRLFGGAFSSPKRDAASQASLPASPVYKTPKPPPEPAPSDDDDPVGSLNPEQKEVVLHGASPLLIVAGPGAGKTRTLTHRIACMIRNKNISPDTILAVTFTNKAAREMAERLKNLLPTDVGLPLTTTFHGLCLKLLTENLQEPWSVLDDTEQAILIREALRRVKVQGHDIKYSTNALAGMIQDAKQRLMSPDDVLKDGSQKSAFQAVYRAYQTLLNWMAAWDFEDLIFNVVQKLDQDANFQAQCRQRFKWIFVDEYQDINFGQYQLIRRLCPTGEGLCVVCDPDQSIYGFRGSDVRFFQQFSDDFPNRKTIRLARNYRSVETILKASAQVLGDHSIDREGVRVYSGLQGVERLTILEGASERAEAVAVGKIIERMVGGASFYAIDFGKTDSGTLDRAFSDFGVLFRTKAQGQLVSEVFESAGIPWHKASRELMYDQPGIAPLLACMRLMEGVGRLGDFDIAASLPQFGLGKTSLGRFRTWFFDSSLSFAEALQKAASADAPTAADLGKSVQRKIQTMMQTLSCLKRETANQPVADKLDHVVKALDVWDVIAEENRRCEAYEHLKTIAADFGHDAASFLNAIALETDPDACAENIQKVSLMTLHAAKGLEFPVVFIMGCEDGLIPFHRPNRDDADLDEERRLFYVGMTRAKEQLFLSWSKKRTLYGKTLERQLSPFVADIEKQLLKQERQVYKKKKKEGGGQVQLDMFN